MKRILILLMMVWAIGAVAQNDGEGWSQNDAYCSVHPDSDPQCEGWWPNKVREANEKRARKDCDKYNVSDNKFPCPNGNGVQFDDLDDLKTRSVDLQRESLSFTVMMNALKDLPSAGLIQVKVIESALDCYASVTDVNGCYDPKTNTVFLQPSVTHYRTGVIAGKQDLETEKTFVHELRHAFQHAKLGEGWKDYCDFGEPYYSRRCERDAAAFSAKVLTEAEGTTEDRVNQILSLYPPSEIPIYAAYIKEMNGDALNIPYAAAKAAASK